MSRPSTQQFAAVVLAGGTGRRLGGVDKAALQVGGRSLLDRALAAVDAASTKVVVGPPRALPDGVMAAQEQPPGGGPVAAVAAGLDALTTSTATAEPEPPAGIDLVVVLACDMPFLDAGGVSRLVATLRSADAGVDGAAFVDSDGRRQHLAAVYRRVRIEAALRAIGRVQDAAMRELAKRLTIVEIQADPETTLDCDTWPDVRRSHDALEEP